MYDEQSLHEAVYVKMHDAAHEKMHEAVHIKYMRPSTYVHEAVHVRCMRLYTYTAWGHSRSFVFSSFSHI